jgi:phospholipase/carboxylesterase
LVLQTFEIEPTEAQRGSVIWLHGLGATSHDFEPIVPELETGYLRFVFPQAPVRPVTINQGMRMPAWYDILSFDNPPLREKESDVREASAELQNLIEREHARGVRYEDIVLAGFSQGGAMALHVGLRAPQALAGVLVLSGYLVVPQHLEEERAPANQHTPILFCHGRYDPVVPYTGGKASYQRVKQAGYPAEWAEFDMEHSLCIEEVGVIKDWLAARFPKRSPLST